MVERHVANVNVVGSNPITRFSIDKDLWQNRIRAQHGLIRHPTDLDFSIIVIWRGEGLATQTIITIATAHTHPMYHTRPHRQQNHSWFGRIISSYRLTG